MTTAASNKPIKRLLEIDALRAIACIIVVITHVAEELSHLDFAHSSSHQLHKLIWETGFGNIGIVIFFAISGYGILGSLRGPLWQGSRDFLLRRFFRLYPVFWLSMLFAILLVWIPESKDLSWSMILANATMLPEAQGYGTLVLVYWTMETELAIYAACMLMFLLRCNHKPYAIIGFSLAFFSLFMFFLLNRDIAPSHAPWLGMPYHIAIALWAAFYRFCNESNAPLKFLGMSYSPWIAFGTLTFILLTPAIFAFITYFIHGNYWSMRNSLPYIIGITGFIIFTKFLPIKSSKLAYYGNLTYAIYLFHHIIIIACIHTFATKYPQYFSLPVYIYIPITILVSSALAYFIYHYVEEKMMNYSITLTRRLRENDS